MSGKTYEPTRIPTRIGSELFKGKTKVVKIISGSNHSLALTSDGHVYGWGDAESGKIVRML